MGKQILRSAKAPGWIGPVTVVSLLVGFLITSAVRIPRPDGSGILYGSRPSVESPPPAGSGIDERDAEIKNLRKQVTELQDAISDRSRQAAILNDDLQESKRFAGLTEVGGPGIEIILRDSKKRSSDINIINEYNIHDRDVMTVVNDIWMSGAEAIAVNGQRVSYSTSFRCEGPVIYVGRVPIASPVKIQAIGNADTLYGALTMQGRYLDNIKAADPAMVEVSKKDRLVLPAFTGSTVLNFAKTVPDKGKNQ
ncbi:MAG TPA: DUF881 domain-containing protein [Fimbriimonadales bacterium]|jgi:uncharacterized protein YlxW (UPF0749 family)|nr:DUF881 domain-containing protein [Fimbriimonadales bacterium]